MKIRSSGVARGGEGGRRRAPGFTDLWCRSFFRRCLNQKPSNLAAKTFFVLISHICGREPTNLTAMTFFGFHLFLDRKGVTPQNPTPGVTIPSNATDKEAMLPRKTGAFKKIFCLLFLRFYNSEPFEERHQCLPS